MVETVFAILNYDFQYFILFILNVTSHREEPQGLAGIT